MYGFIKKIKNSLFIVLLSLFCSVCFAQNGLNGQIQKLIADFYKENQIGAVALAISFHDEQSPRMFNMGVIAQDDKTPIHIGNLFQVGSITKSFVASTILKLQKSGVLSINDNLGKWLPEYKRWSNITLKQLLNHTSGIYNFTDSEQFRTYLLSNKTAKISADELINYSIDEPLYFNPGEGWHYSNTGYVLLGKIIEKATHKKASTVLENLLLKNEDLNLINTAFVTHMYKQDIKKRMTHGYYMYSSGQGIDITNVSMSWLNTAGGIVANVYDLTRWIRHLFDGNILDDSSLNDFTSLVSVKNGQAIDKLSESEPEGYGLGIKAYKTKFDYIGVIWWHSGGTLGYKSLMMWLPKQKIAIAIAYNQVLVGQEVVPFSPNTVFVQKLLKRLNFIV
jgi:D-alanyl-D-alanine carboxypeptidase